MEIDNHIRRFSNQMQKTKKHVILDLQETLSLRAAMTNQNFQDKLIVSPTRVQLFQKTNFTMCRYSIINHTEWTFSVPSTNLRITKISQVHSLSSSENSTKFIPSDRLNLNLTFITLNQDISKISSNRGVNLM